jgi:type I restriction enzyme R subunit
LTQDEQGFAELFLHDVQRGTVQIDEDKTLRDYITEYMTRAKNDRIHRFAEALAMNEDLLREIMNNYMPGDIIPPGPFEQLMLSVDKQKAKSWLEERERVAIQSFRVNMRIDRILRDFIEHGGFEV